MEKHETKPMQRFGHTNFFRLMNSLDEEQINPLRGEGAVALTPTALQTAIASLGPSFGRMGVDLAGFQKETSSNPLNLPRLWNDFIRQQARELLSGDMSRLMSSIDSCFERGAIKSSEINGIVNFVLTYYEVIHRRSINKKEVIEGVLMRGLIKKSSFYQKIAQADKDTEGVLSWKGASKNDDIWRHFSLQTLRFLKQSTFELEDFLEDTSAMRQRLQDRIDSEEYDQFNQGSGRPSATSWLPMLIFAVGLGALLTVPSGMGGNEPSSPQVNYEVGQPLSLDPSANLLLSDNVQQPAISITSGTTVNFTP